MYSDPYAHDSTGPGKPLRGPAFSVAAALLDDFSIEMTGKDIAALEEAAPYLPVGSRISVTYLGTEDSRTRVAAAAMVRRLGFVPVPHIAARRLTSENELEAFLSDLHAQASPEDIFAVAGDPEEPMGPYEDGLALINSDLLSRHGITRVSISGYPEGHPHIDGQRLWNVLEAKTRELKERGLDTTIITQFSFDTVPVLNWLAELRHRGITAPVRIGVPGPAGVRRLLSYASRFGVGTSAGIVQKYGFSLTNLLGTAGPDRFITELAAGYDPEIHGVVHLHFYAFGGLKATAKWAQTFRSTFQLSK